MMIRNVVGVGMAIGVAALLWGCGEGGPGGSGKDSLSIRYDRPATYEIPAKVKSLAVAEFTGKTPEDERYGEIAAAKLESRLDEYNRQFNRYTLVDRRKLKAVMDERDMKLAIADTNQAVKIGKLASADAIIYGNVHAVIRSETGYRTAFDPLSRSTKTVPYTKRYCQATVNFTMVEVDTGKTLTSVTLTQQYDSEKKKGSAAMIGKLVGFGGDDAQVGDQVLNTLVDQCVDEFVARVSPHRVDVAEKLAKGKSKMVGAGNKLALSGDYDGALEYYRQGIAERPDDDGAYFNAGAVSEALGKYKQAMDYYAKAFSFKNDARYAAARQRVRVEAGDAGKPAAVETAPAETGEKSAAPVESKSVEPKSNE